MAYDIDRYLASIADIPLLTVEEERELARRNRSGDKEAGRRLVTSNLRFVVKVAHEYRGYGLPLIDLVQEGNIGLMRAVGKFDPSRKVRLCTYAVWWIRALIGNYIIKNWSLVKIGTTQAQRKLFFQLKGAQRQVERVLGEQAAQDPVLLGGMLHVKPEEITAMSQRLNRDRSLDAPVSGEEDGSISFVDMMTDDRRIDDELIARQDLAIDQTKVRRALRRLLPRDRLIIEKRKMSDPPVTLAQLGQDFGCSRERVRQIELRALSRLKDLLSRPAEEL